MTRHCEQTGPGDRRDAVVGTIAVRSLRRGLVAALAACIALGAFASGAVAQDGGDWSVEGDDGRRAKIVQRYKQLLEKDPSKGVIFDKLVEYVGKDEGVDRLIEQYSEKAEEHPDKVNYQLILGHLHKVKNDNEKALEYYDRAAELAPERPAVWMSRGEAHQNLRNRDKATEDFEKALEKVDRKARKQKLLRKLADIAFEQQDWKRAESYYDQLLELDPRNEYLRQEYAQVLVKHRRYEKALEQYEELLDLAGRNTKSRATTLRDMGDLYEKMGKDKKAVETYRKAKGLVRPDNWLNDALQKRVIGVYRSNDRLGDLLEQYEEQWPSPNYEQSLLLGRLSDDVGEEDQALEYLDRATRLRSGATKPRERKIDILRRRGADDKVLEEYEELIRVAPGETRYQFELVRVYMQRGEREEAIDQLEQIERRSRGKPQAFRKLADAYMRYGMEDEALEAYKRLVEMEPDNESHILSLGESYYRSGSIEKAVETWKRLLETSMEEADARAQLGQVFTEHGMIERGVRNYRKAVEARPDDLSIRRGLANTYERARRWDKAIEVWRHVMEKAEEPAKQAEARGRIISIYKRQHRLRSKLADFEKQFNADPPDQEAGYFLAEGHLKLSNYEKAEKTYRKLIDLDGEKDEDDIEALKALERLYRQTGDLKRAVEVLQTLAELRPKRQREYYHQIAKLSLKLYEDDQAVRYAALAVEKNPEDAEAHARLGEVYRKMHRLEAAAKEYRKAVKLDPKAHRHKMELAELSLEVGDRERAEKLYREVVRKADKDSLVLEAARQAIELAEQGDHLRDLEREFSQLAFRGQKSHVYRKVMLELYERMVTPLMLAMRYGVERERSVVEEELDEIGARAAPILTAALGSGDVGQRALAIRLLGGLREESAGLRLARIAVDEEDSLRTLAAISVAEIGTSRSADPLIEALDSSDPQLRELATWTLGYVGGTEAREALAEQLTAGQNWTQKALAALGLGRVGGEPAAEALRDALSTIPPGESNDSVLVAVAWALGRVGDGEAVDDLVSALRRSPEDVRYVAATALARLDRRDAVRRLLELRWDEREALRDPAMRGLATAAVRTGGASTSDAGLRVRYENLTADTKHIDEREQRLDVGGLVDERRSDARLAGVTRTDAFFVEYADLVAEVARAKLTKGDGVSDSARAVVRDLWRSGELRLGLLAPETDRGRSALSEALGNLQEPLAGLMQSNEPRVAAAALGLLSQVGMAGDSASITGKLSSESASVRAAAIRAYARTDAAETGWEVFESGLDDGNFSVRRATCAALGRVGSESEKSATADRAVELLEGALEDRYTSVRMAAVRALGSVDTERAAEALASRLEEFSLRLKVEALAALASMQTERAQEAVEPYRDHTDYRLRRAVESGSEN